MIIEELMGTGKGFFVGLAEVIKTEQMGRDELLASFDTEGSGVNAIQLLNSALVVDELHLLSAAQNAVNALKGDYMIARSLDVEVAVYASGQKQISKALDKIGVGDDTDRIAVVVIGQDKKAVSTELQSVVGLIGHEPDSSFAPSRRKIEQITRHFGIPESEVNVLAESDDIKHIQEAVSRCVVSRVSAVALDA